MFGFIYSVAIIWALYYFFHYLNNYVDDRGPSEEEKKHEQIWHLFNDNNDPY